MENERTTDSDANDAIEKQNRAREHEAQQIAMALSVNTKERRAERVQVASRVLAAIVFAESSSDGCSGTLATTSELAKEAVDYADQLLARIDETEPKDVL